MFVVDWTQHAVGHGGFHSGRARADDGAEFNWIFDCGARKPSTLNNLLRAWTAQNQQPIDWLFVSHFDNDHVSGLDTLMSRAVVRDVMVPYVNQRELAFQLLYEISRGNLNRPLIELAADPSAYFLSRGAERVTYLRGRGPEPGGEFEPLAPEGDPDDQSWFHKIRPTPRPMRDQPHSATTAGSPPPVRQIVGGACELIAMRGAARLRLVPHTAPISIHSHRGILGDLQAVVGKIPWHRSRPGLGDLAFAIGHLARTATGRASLRKVFKARVGSSNRSSLSLLSIPEVADEDRCHCEVLASGSWPWRWRRGTGGWLNTGDAELRSSADFSAWVATYGRDLARVQMLALPHHGSDKNSDAQLHGLCPDAVLAAHVKSGGKKHPGQSVMLSAGQRLKCVTEQVGTEVRMHFWQG